MFRRSRRGSWRAYFAVLILAGTGIAVPAKAQGFETAVQSRARIFPEINSGVTAMKRDGAGRYYILATPPTVIWVYSPQGKRIGQIPRTDSETAKVQYAVDFDLDPDGRILVADRAANAVEIFSADGSLISKIPVFAPTGVVALPDKQFAVSTLRSKRLVEIRDDRGALVRSFGDPAELGLDPDSKKLQNLGKVSGDGAGDIYFAFTNLPDPTVRKYDRYGYAASEATFAASRYEPSPAPSADDRVQFGVNFSDTNFSDSYNTWATIGNKGDVLFGGGLSPGLGAHLGSQPGTAQSATEGILSTGLAKGPGGGGPGGAAGGGTLSAQGSYQGNSLQLHVGGKSSRTGGAGNSGESSGSTGSGEDAILQFSPQDLSSNDSLGTGSSDDDTQALLFSQFSDQGLSAGAGAPGYGPGARGGGGGTFAGIGLFPGLGSFGRFGGTNVAGGIGGGFAFHDFSQGAGTSGLSPIGPSTLTAPAPNVGAPAPKPTAGGAGDFHAGGPGRPGESHFGGPHGGYGRDLYNLTGTVKVNLDHFPGASDDKPVITAVGVDPISQDIWAAIGRVLVHFDKNGGYLADYYIVSPEGTPLRTSAIIVEPNRLIVATESRGIFEFARPDTRAPHSSIQGSIVDQEAPSQPTVQQ